MKTDINYNVQESRVFVSYFQEEKKYVVINLIRITIVFILDEILIRIIYN